MLSAEPNRMERRAIPDLLNKNYYIPEYQRGYRWEEKQVLDLLEDLYAFFTNNTDGQFYCLQPIVVKEKQIDGELWYEVIDGQQRLTTLRIIMQIFDQLNSVFGRVQWHRYVIRYATRPNMQPIFERILITQSEQGDLMIDELQNKWSDLIDSLYIFNAAKTVLNWFYQNGDDSRIGVYKQFFYKGVSDDSKSVQVVWYETREQKVPHDIFNRMNSLKVGLSCSELIRSLFLSKTTKFKMEDLSKLSDSLKLEIENERKTHKQVSINEKWDELEQQMRDKKFQSFLTNRTDTGRNSIGFLFDLISGKYASDKAFRCPYSNLHKEDELYTYLFFKNKIEQDKDAWTTWESVLNDYEKLRYWYSDRNLYHLIGFLNAIAVTDHADDAVCSLLSLKLGRTAIYDKVVEMVQRSVSLPKDKTSDISSLSQLGYDKKIHYDYIKQLLLLYNVETTREMKEGDFFDFNRYRYKANGKLKVWTLEHIHAQNSDCLPENKKEPWLEWIKYNLAALEKLSLGDPMLIEQQEILKTSLASVKDICLNVKFTYDDIKAKFQEVVQFYALLDKTEDKARPVHQLSNMALLDLGQNAMIGNAPFEVKRQIICNQIADGEYFPICTQKVFLKLYDRETLQVHSWGQQDRILYYEDMKKKLVKYLDPKVF